MGLLAYAYLLSHHRLCFFFFFRVSERDLCMPQVKRRGESGGAFQLMLSESTV